MLNFDDEDTYNLILSVCRPFGVDPSVPIESEAFFRKLLTHYSGNSDDASISGWLRQEIEKHFIALGARPRWIQSPEWPFANGEPMIFVGQIDLSVQEGKPAAGFFHDDTSLYVFVGKKVPPVVIMQQF